MLYGQSLCQGWQRWGVCWWNYCWNLKILEFGILNIVYSSVFIRYSQVSFNPRLWWPNPFSSFMYLNIWFITVNRERFAELNFVFSRLSGVPRKFFHEYKHLSLIVLNKEHLWPRQRKSISVKTSMALKPWIFSSANLYPSIWYVHIVNSQSTLNSHDLAIMSTFDISSILPRHSPGKSIHYFTIRNFRLGGTWPNLTHSITASSWFKV